MRKLIIILFTSCLTVLSGCITIPASTKPTNTASFTQGVKIDKALPSEDFLPAGVKPIGDTGYIFLQVRGGSILLGPVFGALNIKAKTKKMADNLKGHYVTVSPGDMAESALNANSILTNNSAQLVVHPYVIVQHCVDDKLRLTLSYNVNDLSTKWVGRYSYHLPTAIPLGEFNQGTSAGVKNMENELIKGSNIIAKLISQDFMSKLSSQGRKAEVGSLYLLGDKIGGMGIYTQPEEIYFENADVLEDKDDHLIIRMKGKFGMPPMMHGLTYGIHYFDRNLIHTLNYQ